MDTRGLCDTCNAGMHIWTDTHWPPKAACTRIIILSVVIYKNAVKPTTNIGSLVSEFFLS